MAPRSSGRLRQGGFTYLGLIILVAVIGMVGAATLKIDSLLRRAAAEEELLGIGAEFSAALASYAAATPKGQPEQPPTLQELLKDPRTPGLRRHLRKIFVDPVTGSTEWGMVYLGDHVGVIGVYSLSQARPLKIGNFDPRFVGFENKQHLSEWKFTAGLPPLAPPPAAPASPLLPSLAVTPGQPAAAAAPPPPPPPPVDEGKGKAEEPAEEKTDETPPQATDER